MKMPFPGMDPYLEHPALWPSVHARLMVILANQLRPLIRPRYVASVEERVYLEGEEQQRIPDVSVQQVRPESGPPSGAVAAVDTPLIVEIEPLEIHEHFIEVLDRYQDSRVVTVIEVVSPTNKTAGPGRDSYLAKQRETLASSAHLVEIDLLRRGRHALAVPERRARALASYDYLASISRSAQRQRFEIYPRRLRERLPRLGLPLAAPDRDVPLDLQAALEQVYEEGDYALRVRYDESCVPALDAAEQQWAGECWAAYRAVHPELFPGTNS